MDSSWFQLTPPLCPMTGTYNLTLVSLSFLIAFLASYVALDLAGRLRQETNPLAKWYWLGGGAFAMGAGIWSMHFIGMLAFIMPMSMGYELFWTGTSLLAAILASGLALFLLRDKDRKVIYLVMGGVLMGLGIATMHYMGMQGMTPYIHIRYWPGLFTLSIAIAIFASEAALWLALQSNQGTHKQQFRLKIISAIVMGIAICGMHYVGMAAAVFTPLENAAPSGETIPPELLAFFIAGITALIISLALTVSSYYKKMIYAIHNEKEFLNAMLDNLEDGIIACDSEGHITVFNQAFDVNTSGLKKNATYKDLADIFTLYLPGNDYPLKDEESPLYRTLQGERIHALEVNIKFKNNIHKSMLIDGQPIINGINKKLGAVIVFHDITDKKKSEKMKSEFVSVVSHELRTPLTSIRGSIGLLLGGTIEHYSEKTIKLLDIANKNCERLLILISDILDMEKIQAGKMNFDLKDQEIDKIVNEAITINKMYGEKYNVKFLLTNNVENVIVKVDSDRLLQVLANLLSNAAKFSNKDGIVTINVTRENDFVRVTVTDTGAGIPIEFQSRIFTKFSQADSSDTRGKGGTGLGLSISKALIEKMGGSLKFHSEPNKETTFYFDLPIIKTHTELMVPPALKDRIAKILICEDDEDQANYLQVLLENAGLPTDIASTVKEAKMLLAKKNYRAVLLDLILPDEDGISFIRELRQADQTRELPIIVLSIITSAGKDLLKGDAISVVDWLDKPVNFDKLLSAIARIKSITKSRSPRILHVEDDLDTQHVIATLLEKIAEITATTTINEAIQKIGSHTYDLVILDLLLPDGKGSDLLPIFSKYNLPIIVYSAFELDQEYSKYVSQSLVKSKTSNGELITTIKNILE